MTLPDEGYLEHAKPFLEHLEDLRRTLLWCAVALAVGIIIAVPLTPWILELLKIPLEKAHVDPDIFLRVIRVTESFSISAQIIFWGGLLISIPLMVLAIGNFVFLGLRRRERRAILHMSGFAAALFVGGVCMGYFWTVPVALQVMFQVNKWLGVRCEFVELSDYVGFVLKLLIAFGLAFQLPVIILALGSMEIVTSEQLRKIRPYVIVGLLVVAAIMTPTTDPLSQVLMAAPMAVLYEFCIWMIRMREQRRSAVG